MDADDDKIPNTSPNWAKHGMRRTPTKDKKLKPVFHLQATIASGYITMMIPDTLKLQMKDMIKQMIEHLVPDGPGSEALRASLVFFIDRGYLEIAKYQDGEVKNLIQIMKSMGVKFLGTIKDSSEFPFEVVDIKTDDETVRNGRPVVQAFGSRVEHRAVKDGVVAGVMRNGGGKTRVARIATNMPEAKRDGWVVEIEQEMK